MQPSLFAACPLCGHPVLPGQVCGACREAWGPYLQPTGRSTDEIMAEFAALPPLRVCPLLSALEPLVL